MSSSRILRVSYATSVRKPPEAVFVFFSHIDQYYTQLNKGHKKFVLRNADTLAEGTLIDSEEEAGGQFVRHQYRVAELRKGTYIKLVSDPSVVSTFRVFRMPVKVIVEFEFKTEQSEETQILSQLTLEFPNAVMAFFARAMGTGAIWQAHLQEELENGARIIESG